MSTRVQEDIGRAVRDYLRTLEDTGRSPETIRRAHGTLRGLVRGLARGGVREVAALAPEAVARWAERLARRGLAPATVATEIEGVRGFARWLHRDGRTLADAGHGLPRARVPHQVEVRVLGEGEVARLYGAARGKDPRLSRDRALLEVLYAAGARRREAAALEVRDLDLAEGTLTIRRGKGGRARVVPLPARAVAELAR